ncbi:lipase lipl-4-like [Eriocheir sinensis]|uniref:lipase lipl-4-like n=1 Tax=Eriocheir sinensis TaxID=95602 RepID=UPI0021C86BC1|nr:lipase lipl-4-like [Eriocheir sinensis]
MRPHVTRCLSGKECASLVGLMVVVVAAVVAHAGGGEVPQILGAEDLNLESLPKLSRSKRNLHPHARLPTPELIRARGYPAEVHQVVTEDKYILEIHRIPHGRHESPVQGPTYKQPYHDGKTYSHTPSRPNTLNHNHHQQYPAHPYLNAGGADSWPKERHHNTTILDGDDVGRNGRRVVFLFHGITCSSADYVMNDPNQALGFVMADAGYDVWIGNIRGNFYGRRHVSLSPEEEKFWDFTWSEPARYDVPAMLSYVMKVSGSKKVSYVGHSMGASLLFVSLHLYPVMNTWLHGVAALAPAAYMHNKQGPLRVVAPFIEEIEKSFRRSGKYELLPLRPERPYLAHLCSPLSFLNPVCSFIHFLIGGPNENYVDPNYLPVIYAHTPAGTNFRILTHLLQIVRSQKFQAFDYGQERNVKEYGTPSPPRYSLGSVRVPVGVFWAENDWVVDPKDVALTASELPWVAYNYKVPLKDFNHLDFMWAENAAELVYKPVLEYLRKCEQREFHHNHQNNYY